jgi:hypothetical protein
VAWPEAEKYYTPRYNIGEDFSVKYGSPWKRVDARRDWFWIGKDSEHKKIS